MKSCAICCDSGRLRRSQDGWYCVDRVGCHYRARLRLGVHAGVAAGLRAKEIAAAKESRRDAA